MAEPIGSAATKPDEAPEPQPSDTPEPAQPKPDDDHASREAGRYRKRLRAVEQERDRLRERIDEFERREVEALARDLGAAIPSDLWTLIALDDLRNGDGVLDSEEARSKVNAILAERPTWRRPAPDLGAGARSPAESHKPGLSALLGKRQ